jgi:tRNA-splicing ligase RtcB
MKPMTFEGPPEAQRIASWIETLPYVANTVRLPDFHLKPGMEAPSSFVVATNNVIIPHLVSESINDGMGLIATGLDIDDVSQDQIRQILTQVNEAAARTKASESRYSWSTKLLEAACREGAAPLLDHYGMPESFLDNIEDRGRSMDRDLTYEEFSAAVPKYLQRTKLTRCEIGLNFGGNHFLEVQVVDEIVDKKVADEWNLAPGRVMVMYHLGPGPLGSMLSNLYAYREKGALHRKVGYALIRNLMHMRKGREYHRAFAAFNDWLTLDAESDQGAAYANVLNVIKNYGFAYRVGTIKGIFDAVHDVIGTGSHAESLIIDMSHNILQPERIGSDEFWVSRHNCCRPVPGLPGIVAGNHQVSSCLTVGPPGCADSISGYDHGVGYLINEAQKRGDFAADIRGHEVQRMMMTRGTNRLHAIDTLPLLDRRCLDATLTELKARGTTTPVAMLRPLATLKHKI